MKVKPNSELPELSAGNHDPGGAGMAKMREGEPGATPAAGKQGAPKRRSRKRTKAAAYFGCLNLYWTPTEMAKLMSIWLVLGP